MGPWTSIALLYRDCNANGVEDNIDLWQGSAADCDGNGIPDVCDVGVVAEASFAGIPTLQNRLVFETNDLAPALAGDDTITVNVRAAGGFASSIEFVTVLFDGMFLGFAFADDGLDCTEQTQSFEIPSNVWNAAMKDGTRTIEVYAAPTVDPSACNESQMIVSVAYLGESADCDDDGTIDLCAVSNGDVVDCNDNQIPDGCELTSGSSSDIDEDGVPDECQPDCNANGLPDAYELAEDLVEDCDENDIIDSCEVQAGADINNNNIPDACDVARGDFDLDGCVGPADLGFMLALWGIPNPPIGDLNGDGVIRAADLGILIANWDCGL